MKGGMSSSIFGKTADILINLHLSFLFILFFCRTAFSQCGKDVIFEEKTAPLDCFENLNKKNSQNCRHHKTLKLKMLEDNLSFGYLPVETPIFFPPWPLGPQSTSFENLRSWVTSEILLFFLWFFWLDSS